ncbi:alpha/beta fold hydrolase [Silvimonas iriomotensis]|uniref:Sigma factor SigB regulation protein RsbQ n=1 Tax=Silvimonas iriomotensis TaxID=449662 RepID=A0ABQ2PC22_9NEIS|nr:alpha/beta hydrolase [Silvimonas iriomotensis]GGP22680.1 sigma factor SigB regulation protein RsbQ [Silvimonas iriomotensis]
MPASVLQRHHVQIVGDGPITLVLAHGFACDQTIWRKVVPELSSGYRLILFDHAGHGMADAFDTERHATLDGYAEDVVAVLEALDLWNVVYVGHSVSGMIGLLASKLAPRRIERMVMLAPSPCYINHPQDNYVGGFERSTIDEMLKAMDHNYQAWAEQLAQIASLEESAGPINTEMRHRLFALDPTLASRFAHAIFLSDLRDQVQAFALPTLIVQCSDDPIAPVNVGQWMERAMHAARLHVMTVRGHLPQLANAPQVASLIRNFVQ